jgi:hypothetical protein
MTRSRLSVGQVLLGLVGLVSLQLGVWATLAPRSFYDDFPGGGRHWVDVNGPYNEHFIRDFGGLNLALAILLLTAAVIGGPTLIRLGAAAALAFGVPHLIFHLRHTDVYATDSDKVANVVALSLAVGLPLIALVLSLRSGRTETSPGERR